MLLAFPLFVVFVAVDIRWVAAALAKQYPGMSRDKGDDEFIAPASNYLEKILQIPYWVPMMGPEEAARLLTDLAAPLVKLPKDDNPSAEQKDVDVVVAAAQPLSGTEVIALQEYGKFLRSPRKLLRLLNVVRLLKVSGYLGGTSGISELKLHALFAQATIATAAPDSYASWTSHLREFASNDQATLNGLLKHLDLEYKGIDLILIKEILVCFRNHDHIFEWKGQGVKPLLECSELARRFSFSPTP